jgi:WD40 repeat protein
LGSNILTDFQIQGLRNAELLEWSSDGKELVVHELGKTEVHIVDYATHGILNTYRLNIAPDTPVVWSPNKDMLLFQANNKRIVVWDVANGEISATLSDYPGQAIDLKWHPQSSHVVIAGEDGVWIWNIETNAATIVQREKAFAVDWSPDAQQLVTHLGTEMRVYDIIELP